MHRYPELGILPEILRISDSRPLARVAHKCTICGLPIAIGTRYARHIIKDTSVLDKKHSFKVFKWHLPSCPISEEARSWAGARTAQGGLP